MKRTKKKKSVDELIKVLEGTEVGKDTLKKRVLPEMWVHKLGESVYDLVVGDAVVIRASAAIVAAAIHAVTCDRIVTLDLSNTADNQVGVGPPSTTNT